MISVQSFHPVQIHLFDVLLLFVCLFVVVVFWCVEWG